MDQPLFFPTGIIKELPISTGIQICRMSDEYCITASETASHAAAEKLILITLTKDELKHLIGAMTSVMEARAD